MVGPDGVTDNFTGKGMLTNFVLRPHRSLGLARVQASFVTACELFK